MCGPVGTGFCLGLSIFGTLFMGVMAVLLKRDYQYLGEWFDTSEPGHASYEEQRDSAMNMCWTVAAVYGGFALASALGMCYYSMRAKRA